METFLSSSLYGIVLTLADLAVMARILLRPNRDPASRIAWLIVVGAVPVFGILIYLLFGEVSIGRRRAERMREVMARLPKAQDPGREAPVPDHYRSLFELGHSISGFRPVGGNSARLMPDSNATIDAMVADIDAATDHVHLLFYIWLADNNGRKIIDALNRAAARGVTCRAMADDLGSRALIRSEHWQAMRRAGVSVASGLPIGNPLLRLFAGRIDLRNHRKIVVIDGAHHLLRQPELRRPGIPGQGEICALGRCGDPLRGADRPAEPDPVRQRLDGRRRRGHRTTCCTARRPRRRRPPCRLRSSAPGRRCAIPPCAKCLPP